MKTVSIDYLRDLFDADFDAGVLVWRARPASHFKDRPRRGAKRIAAWWNAKHAGKIAGALNSEGYLRVSINGNRFFAHRVIWAMAHGRWPSEEIDHINGNRRDNRVLNLREVSRSVNNKNLATFRGGASRFKGVHFYKLTGKWQARITIDGRLNHLGYFDNEEEAASAYRDAAVGRGFTERHLQPAMLLENPADE